jgi:hypothetical protein
MKIQALKVLMMEMETAMEMAGPMEVMVQMAMAALTGMVALMETEVQMAMVVLTGMAVLTEQLEPNFPAF